MTEQTRVVVIGGGYAGVMAANRLTRRRDVAVTLVNPRAAFVERIRLHQLVGGSDDAIADYRSVLARGVRLLVDTVDRIDAPARRLALTSGGTLDYDHLVYALGSDSARSTVTGVAEHAVPLATLEQAQHLRATLAATPVSAPVVVVGAGPLGLEVAAELAEGGRAVTLVCGGTLGPLLHPDARRAAARRLSGLGATVVDGSGTRVIEVLADAVRLEDGRELPSALTVWTAGFGAPDLAARSGLTTDGVGRLLTDETLTSVDDARIVAAGDAAAPSGLPYRMSCQAAVQLGPQAAETVLSRIAGRTPAPAEVGFVATCLSLGRRGALQQFAHRDDSPMRRFLTGRPAVAVKELICRGTVWQLAIEARRPGLVRMRMKDPGRARALQAARLDAPVG